MSIIPTKSSNSPVKCAPHNFWNMGALCQDDDDIPVPIRVTSILPAAFFLLPYSGRCFLSRIDFVWMTRTTMRVLLVGESKIIEKILGIYIRTIKRWARWFGVWLERDTPDRRKRKTGIGIHLVSRNDAILDRRKDIRRKRKNKGGNNQMLMGHHRITTEQQQQHYCV